MQFITTARLFQEDSEVNVTKKKLLDSVPGGASALTALIKKGIFELYSQETDRLLQENSKGGPSKLLNDFQEEAFISVKEQFKEKDVVLLHGVTSCGKTEIYIQLIKEYLTKGEQVLYLLPEIALTAQIINRLTAVFGEKVGIYHSKFSDNERVEIWNRVLNASNDNAYKLILGARSAVFLPFVKLGLVIVDEEHENSFKQFDPAPRYNARDAAIVLSGIHKAKTLLGTATPSIESYYNATTDKYGFVEITRRYQDIQLPDIKIANTKEAYKRKQMRSHFTPLLIARMEAALAKKEQIILFQNRRGFSPYIECGTCTWIPKCEYCDVSLTYHKHLNHIVCHYCGYSIVSPVECGACGASDMRTKGFGTEKVEDEIAIFFPDVKVARMDMDTTRTRSSYERIIAGFENREIDILVGTQMVTKGLDFDNVSVVGILNADNMLNFADFRAHERSFQLMAQVGGRSGRKKKRGEVIIQTANPDHNIIGDVLNNNYKHMYYKQLDDRKAFNYPPFFRLISITLKHRDKQILNKASRQLAEDLRLTFGSRVLGPEYPAINRIQSRYIKKILLKVEREKAGKNAKTLLLQSVNRIRNQQEDKTLQVVLDVDPM